MKSDLEKKYKTWLTKEQEKAMKKLFGSHTTLNIIYEWVNKTDLSCIEKFLNNPKNKKNWKIFFQSTDKNDSLKNLKIFIENEAEINESLAYHGDPETCIHICSECGTIVLIHSKEKEIMCDNGHTLKVIPI
jgi:hypothetical protein